jgi:hypothetical protein
MKRHLTLTIAIMMFMAAVTITAEAQVFGSKEIQARIPFSFNVGSRTLPAGDYTVKVLNPNSDRRVLQIRSKNGRLCALVHANGIKSNNPNNAKLVFNRYGDTYFFAQAQMAGDSTALAAVKTSAERHKQTELARNGSKPAVEILAE